MRTWLSFRTPFRGIRAGVSLPNPAARTYYMSATGQKIWLIGSALMWGGLAIWLFTSRDQDGRLNEWWWLVIIAVWCGWYIFGRAVARVDQLRRAQRGDGPS